MKELDKFGVFNSETSSSKPFPQCSESYAEQGKEWERWVTAKERVSSRHSRAGIPMNSKRFWKHVQGLHQVKPHGTPAMIWVKDTALYIPLTKNLSALDIYMQRNDWFSSIEFHYSY